MIGWQYYSGSIRPYADGNLTLHEVEIAVNGDKKLLYPML